jgi:hypothetical protein
MNLNLGFTGCLSACCLYVCTAKTKCRKFETNIPRKEYRGLSPNFHIHVSVSELFIPTMGLPVLLEEICRLILGYLNSSKTHECGNWC